MSLNKTHTLNVTAFLAGLIFGIGLLLSSMVNPKKVLGFLNVFGEWDPSLAFVMLGALVVSGISFKLINKSNTSLLNQVIQLPETRLIDKSLTLGSFTFGVGWGISGICPGPAVVLIGMLNDKGFVFFLAMLAGFASYQFLTDGK